MSSEIPRLKKEGRDVSDLLSEMKVLSDDIKANDDAIRELEEKINRFLSTLPNIPADDVVAGGKENNKVIRTWGKNLSSALSPKTMLTLQPIWDSWITSAVLK